MGIRMPKEISDQATDSCMSPEEAKRLIKQLGLNGVSFSKLMGYYTNYVTDFTRKGVPDNTAIILRLSVELKEKGVDPIEIIKTLKSRPKEIG